MSQYIKCNVGYIIIAWLLRYVSTAIGHWYEILWKQGSNKCLLTHWGRVTHVCVSKLTIIGSDNGFSPGRYHAIIWTNVGILLIVPLGTNLKELLIEIHTSSFKKMHWKMSSAKCRFNRHWPFERGIHRSAIGDFPRKGPAYVFVLHNTKLSNKQSSCQLFETLLCSCDVTAMGVCFSTFEFLIFQTPIYMQLMGLWRQATGCGTALQ